MQDPKKPKYPTYEEVVSLAEQEAKDVENKQLETASDSSSDNPFLDFILSKKTATKKPPPVIAEPTPHQTYKKPISKAFQESSIVAPVPETTGNPFLSEATKRKSVPSIDNVINQRPDEPATYSYQGQEIDRNQAMDIISQATDKSQLNGLSVSNDPEVMDGAQRRLSSFSKQPQGQQVQQPQEISPEAQDNSFFENAIDGIKVASRQAYSALLTGASETIDAAQALNPHTGGIGWYNQVQQMKAKGTDIGSGAGLRRESTEQGDIAEQMAKSADPESIGFFVGSVIPYTIGTIAAIGTSYVSAPLAATVGAANIAALAMASYGSGLQEYDKYKTEKGKEIDPYARQGIGLLYGTAEMAMERLSLSKFLPKQYRGKLGEIIFGSIPEEILEKTGTDMFEEFARSSASRAKLATALIKESGTGALTEGGTELGTQILQEYTNFIYQEREDYKPFLEIMKESALAFAGGALMGGFMGPLSYGAQQSQHSRRRKQAGKVVLAQNMQTGETLEIAGIANEGKKKPNEGGPVFPEGELIYQAIRPNGKTIEVSENEIGEVLEMPLKTFNGLLNGGIDGQKVAEEQGNQEIAQKAKEKIDEFKAQYEDVVFTDALGNDLISVGMINGKEHFIVGKSTDKGIIVQPAEGGEKKIISVDKISNVKSIPFSEFVAQAGPIPENAIAPFDPSNPIQKGETITISGPEVESLGLESGDWVVTGANMDEGVVQIEGVDGSPNEGRYETLTLELFQQFRKPAEENINPQVEKTEKTGGEKLRDIFGPGDQVNLSVDENSTKIPENSKTDETKPENDQAGPGGQKLGGQEQTPSTDGKQEPGIKGPGGEVQVTDQDIESKIQQNPNKDENDEIKPDKESGSEVRKESQNQNEQTPYDEEGRTDEEGGTDEEVIDLSPQKKKKYQTEQQKYRERILSIEPNSPRTYARWWLLTGGQLRTQQSESDKSSGKTTGRGVMEETGMAGIETRKLVGLINNKTGFTVEEAADEIWNNIPHEEIRDQIDPRDIRNEMIDIIQSEPRSTWLQNQARDMGANSVTQDEELEARLSMMSPEEYADYEEYNAILAYLSENETDIEATLFEYQKSDEYKQYLEENGIENKPVENGADKRNTEREGEGTGSKLTEGKDTPKDGGTIQENQKPGDSKPDSKPTSGKEQPTGRSSDTSGETKSRTDGTKGADGNFKGLNPKGKFIQALQSARDAGLSGEQIETLEGKGQKLSNFRKQYPQLTDIHENEIFDALNEKDAKPDQISKKIADTVNRFDFDPKGKIGLIKEDQEGPANKRSEIDRQINRITKRLREISKLPKTNTLAQTEKRELTKELNRLNQARQETITKGEAEKPADQGDMFGGEKKKTVNVFGVDLTPIQSMQYSKWRDNGNGFPHNTLTPEERTEQVKDWLEAFGSKEEKPSQSKQETLNKELNKKEQELKDLFDDFFDAGKGNLTSGGITPEQFSIAGKIIAKAGEVGIVRFKQLIEWVRKNIGEAKLKDHFDAFKAAYVANLSLNNPMDESLDEVSKMQLNDIFEESQTNENNQPPSKKDQKNLYPVEDARKPVVEPEIKKDFSYLSLENLLGDIDNKKIGWYESSGELDEGPIMRFSVEKQRLYAEEQVDNPNFNYSGAYKLILEHNYTQNGDLMTDPRIDIAVLPSSGIIIPLNYEMNGMGIYKRYVDDGKIIDRKGLIETKNFLIRDWIPNLLEQGRAINQDADLNFGKDGKQGQKDQGPTSGEVGNSNKGNKPGNVLQPKEDKKTKPVSSGTAGGSKPNTGQTDGTGNRPDNSNGDSKRNVDGGDITKRLKTVDPLHEKKKKKIKQNRSNYVIEEGFTYPDTFKKAARLDDNIKAMEIVARAIENNETEISQKDKDTLFNYAGFGGLDDVLKDPDGYYSRYDSEAMKERYVKVYALAKKIDPDGSKKVMKSIRDSVLTAHYTEPEIIRAKYDLLKLAGFQGGNVLEPSSGIGNYLGSMPAILSENSKLTGIELDYFSSQIHKLLYPEAKTINSGFENANIPKNSQDLIISNTPFGDISVRDPLWSKVKNPIYGLSKRRVHNYFIVKAIESAREGGLIAFLTTSSVLDTPGNKFVREYMNDNTRFIGAVRLPNTAFKGASGTKVVSDIIFLQKREAGEFIRNQPDFVDSNQKKVDGVEVNINEYFENNPEKVLGNIAFEGGMYDRQKGYTINEKPGSKPLREQIFSALEKELKSVIYTASNNSDAKEQHKKLEVSGVDEKLISGNVYSKNGKFYTVIKNQSGDTVGEELSLFKKETQVMSDFIDVRSSMVNLLEAESIPTTTDSELKTLRNKLQKDYDTFLKAHGRLKEHKNTVFKDIQGFQTAALEITDDKGDFLRLSDIFSKRTVGTNIVRPTSADSPSEAVMISKNEYGKVNPARIEQLLGPEWEELTKDVLFKTPDGSYHYKEDYLSGNVLDKIDEVNGIPGYERNVEELTKVIPEAIPAQLIDVPIGARYVPLEFYNKFVRDTYGYGTVSYNSVTDTYSPTKELSSPKFSTDYITPKEVLKAAFSDKTVRIYRREKNSDGTETSVFDQQRTDAANDKVNLVKDEWKSWLSKNADILEDIAIKYNRIFNATVKKVFTGDYLTFPGLVDIKLRPHQKEATAMIIENNGGVVDHTVGAGKTLVMITSIMEMKRLGVAKKPVVVVKNDTVGQVYDSFRQAYPNAKVLSPSPKDFTAARRKVFLNQIALNDWDAIILTHQQFTAIDPDPEFESKVISDEMMLLEEAIESSKEYNLSRVEEKNLIKRLKKLDDALNEKKDQIKKDKEVPHFGKLGIDHIMVDESQDFKNLSYTTTHGQVAGLGTKAGNQKTFDLLMKIRQVQALHKGDKGVTFLSGTPISNSMAELYLIFKYLIPSKLEQLQIKTFDAWAKNFAEKSSELEISAAGKLNEKERFRAFINVPDLVNIYTEIANIKTYKDIEEYVPRPKIKGGAVDLVKIPQTKPQAQFFKKLLYFNNNFKQGGGYVLGLESVNNLPDDKIPIGLIVNGLSTKATLDMRLLYPEAKYDPNSKVGLVTKNVADSYKETDKDKGVNLIFMDEGMTSQDNKKFKTLDEIKRVFVEEHGIPANQVAIVNKLSKPKRKELWAKARKGEVRILIGGTQNMGTGVNVQDRVVGIHHLDTPWRPSDFEQRNGRGLRFGNLLAPKYGGVDIKVYGVEKSLDAAKYDVVAIKQWFIDQMRTNKFERGTINDAGGDEESGFDQATIAAELSGNPIIKEKAKNDKVIQKLENSKKNFYASISRANSIIKQETFGIERANQVIEAVHKYEKIAEIATGGEDLIPKVKGKEFEKVTDAGEYLLKQKFYSQDDILALKRESVKLEPQLTYGDINLYVYRYWDKLYQDNLVNYQIELSDPSNPSKKYYPDEGRLSGNPAIAAGTVKSWVKGLDKVVERNEANIKFFTQNLEKAKEVAESEWDKQEEYNSAIAERDRISAEVAKMDQEAEDAKETEFEKDMDIFGPMKFDDSEFDSPDVDFKRTATDQTKAKAFKEWFGDSKVVDSEGNPLVVYHGTMEDFNEFQGYDNFNFFSEDRDYASRYADEGEPMHVYLSIKNPLDLTNFGTKEIPREKFISFLENKIGKLRDDQKEAIGANNKSAPVWVYVRDDGFAFRKQIEDSGYDGIKQVEFIMNPDENENTWIAFSPTQVKSTTGNQGTFDSKNPDIRFKATKEQPKPKSPQGRKIQRIANEFTSDWKNKPEILVFNSEKEALEHFGNDYLNKQGLQGVEAFIYTDPDTGISTVAILANNPNNSNVDRLKKNIIHESVGHYGIRKFIEQNLSDKGADSFRKEFNKILDGVIDGRSSDPLMARLAIDYTGIPFDQLSTTQKRKVAEEYIAHKAETEKGDWIDKIVASIREWIKKLGVKLRYSDAEIRNLIANGYKIVQNGPMAGQFKPGADNADFSKSQNELMAEVVDGFYSPIEKRIQEFKQPKASATKWKEIVGKKDEAQWTGIFQYLDGLKPDQQVTKEELVDWMKDNRVRVEVVEKGKIKREKDPNIKLYEDRMKELYPDAKEIRIVPLVISATQRTYDAFVDGIQRVRGGQQRIDYFPPPPDNTRFSQLQLPGDKTDYKEVLVTLPKKRQDTIRPQIMRIAENDPEWISWKEKTRNRELTPELIEERDRIVSKPIYQRVQDQTKTLFKSTHFDEPNILVHLRMNTRTDANGNKVLFLEEIQSDWGQQGKRKGFSQKSITLTEENTTVELSPRGGAYRLMHNGLQYADITKETGDRMSKKDLHSELIFLANKYGKNEEQRKTPAGPFVTDTNSWIKLGLKVALQQAVNTGAQKIAWTTGEQQNNRYDLSKQIELIDVNTNISGRSEGERAVYVQLKDNNDASLFVDSNGKITGEAGSIGMGEMQGKMLDEVLGKELAQKIMETKEPTVIKDKGLQVGGSGMKAFYGSPTEGNIGMIGRVMESLVGKKTVQPTGIAINNELISQTSGDLVSLDNLSPEAFELTEKFDDPMGSEMTIEEYVSEMDKLGYIVDYDLGGAISSIIEKNPNLSLQPSITITPAIINQVNQGLPMFKKGQDPLNNPNFREWFGDSKVVDENGKPLVVYHGTAREFSEFNTDYGSFFTPDEDWALFHAGNSSENVLIDDPNLDIDDLNPHAKAVYLSFNNPMVLDSNKIYRNAYLENYTDQIKEAKKKGHDSLIIENSEGGTEYIAFSPTQIKSATGNDGTYSNTNPDIRFKVSPTNQELNDRAEETLKKDLSNWERFTVANVDYMIPARKMVQKVIGDKKLSDEQDFITKENLAKSKARFYTTEFLNKIYNPILEEGKKLNKKYGIYQQDISDYLQARHHAERKELITNQYIKDGKKIPKDEKWPTGLTDQEAEDIIKFFESTVPFEERNDLINLVQKASQFVNDRRHEAGIISDKVYSQLNLMYNDYVPLRGYEELIGEDTTMFSPLMAAHGRKSKAASPIPYLFTAAQEAIIRGQSNIVRQSVLEFVKEFPSKGSFNIRNGWYVKTGSVDEDGNSIWQEQLERPTKDQIESGDAVKSIDPLIQKRVMLSERNDNTIPLYVKGKRVFIDFNDKRIAMAIKNTSMDNLNTVMKTWNKITRTISSMHTEYSPEFGPVNLIRDVGFGTFNIIVEKDPKLALNTLKKLNKSRSTLWKYFKNGETDTSTEDGKLLHEWLEEGGLIGLNITKEASQLFEEAKNAIEQQGKTFSDIVDFAKRNPAKEGIKNAAEFSYQNIKEFVKHNPAMDWLSAYNKVLENAMRFSHYKAMIERGATKQQAAIAAKDLTVNFDRKGNSTSFIASMYMFYNAQIQGIERMARNFTNKKTRSRMLKGVGVVMAAGLTQGILNGLFGSDDDDDERVYSKIPDYVRRTNIILPMPGKGNYLAIPLPYGVNSFYSLGESIGAVITGMKDPSEEALGILTTFSDSFTPLGGFDFEGDTPFLEKLIAFVFPSIGKPGLELAFNRNFFGSQIYRENFTPNQYKKPPSEMYFPGVSPVYRIPTDFLNKSTGGDKIDPGVISWNPEFIEHAVDSYLGGPTKFGNRVLSTLETAISGENAFSDPYYRKLPFIRRFMTKAGTQYDAQQTFYENYREIDHLQQKLRDYEKLERDKLSDFIKENRKILFLSDYAKSTKKQVDSLNDQIDQLKKSDSKAARERIEKLYDARTRLMKGFNRIYNNRKD